MSGTTIVIWIIVVLVIIIVLGVGGYFLFKSFSGGSKNHCSNEITATYVKCATECGEDNNCCGKHPKHDCKNMFDCTGAAKENTCNCINEKCGPIIKDCKLKDTYTYTSWCSF